MRLSQKYTKNISKYIQDISKMPKISKANAKYQAAARPARPKPGLSPVPRTGLPETARLRAWAGLGPGFGRAGGRLVYLSWRSWRSWIYVYIGYTWISGLRLSRACCTVMRRTPLQTDNTPLHVSDGCLYNPYVNGGFIHMIYV